MNAIAAGTHSFDHFVRRNVEVDIEADLNKFLKIKIERSSRVIKIF